MRLLRAFLSAALLASGPAALAQEDPLPSWNDGAARQAIVDFVTTVTAEDGPGFVPPEERIAVFDNDGTLWVEQPMYTQGFFVNDRVHAMAPEHPDWATTQPFQAVLEGDMATLGAAGEQGIVELLAATHADMEQTEFEQAVGDWIATAEHPRFERPFTELAYVPMLEVMDYLRDNDFETWIVSGGGIDFMRPWTERVYGVPPQQVVGSQIVVRFEVVGEVPRFLREPQVFFVDDGPGKPVGILRHIGRQPVIAFGNSDGDFEMLRYTTGHDRPHLAMIVHHTDAEREYAYDRDSQVGRLDRALDAAPDFGWILIDMKTDWARIFAFDE